MQAGTFCEYFKVDLNIYHHDIYLTTFSLNQGELH